MPPATEQPPCVSNFLGWLLVLAINVVTLREYSDNKGSSYAVTAALMIWRAVAVVGLLRYSVLQSFHPQFVFTRSCIGGLALPLFAFGMADKSLQISQTIVSWAPFLNWGEQTLTVVVSAVLVGLYTISHNNAIARTGNFVATFGLLMYLATLVQAGPAYCCVLVYMFSHLFLPVDGDNIMNIPASVWTQSVNAIALLGMVLAFAPLF